VILDLQGLSRSLRNCKYYRKDPIYIIGRWKMNVARVMGNSHDRNYAGDLILAYRENDDERVRAMIAWALGQLGGAEALLALQDFAHDADGLLKDEIDLALTKFIA
jgi:epoxyqueuosine reductase